MTKRFEQVSLDGLDLDEPLADLPLQRTPDGRGAETGDAGDVASESDPSPASKRPAADAEATGDSHNLDLFQAAEELVSEQQEPVSPAAPEVALEEAIDETPAVAAEWERPSLAERLLGGVADITVHVGMLAAALLAMSALSLPVATTQWPGFLLFLFCFSFLYHVVPLAFWGQTPGMALRGLRARDRSGRPLSFGQAGLRWITAVLTFGLLGIPLLPALGEGGALSDRATRSLTWRRA